MRHVHYKEMAQYAEDAAETDKPWERWEMQGHYTKRWYGLHSPILWKEDIIYRRKPRTININGHEVPEPLREAPEVGTQIFIVSLSSQSRDRVAPNRWSNCAVHSTWIDDGLIHLTREAAELHARALLSFTEAK